MNEAILYQIYIRKGFILCFFCFYLVQPTICFTIGSCQIDNQPVIWTSKSVTLNCPVTVNTPDELEISKSLQTLFIYDFPTQSSSLSGDFSGRVTNTANISMVSVTITSFSDPMDVDIYRCKITYNIVNSINSIVDLNGRVFQEPLPSDITVSLAQTLSSTNVTATTSSFNKHSKDYPTPTLMITPVGATVSCSEELNTTARIVTCQLNYNYSGQICAVASLCDVSSASQCVTIGETTSAPLTSIPYTAINSQANNTCQCNQCTRSGNWSAILEVLSGTVLIPLLLVCIICQCLTNRRYNSNNPNNCIPSSRVDIREDRRTSAISNASGRQHVNTGNDDTGEYESRKPREYYNQVYDNRFQAGNKHNDDTGQYQNEYLGNETPTRNQLQSINDNTNKPLVQDSTNQLNDNSDNIYTGTNDITKGKKKKKKKKKQLDYDDNEENFNFNNNNGNEERGSSSCGCSVESWLFQVGFTASLLLMIALVTFTILANDNVTCDNAMCDETCYSNLFRMVGYIMISVSCVLFLLLGITVIKACTCRSLQ